MADINRVILIGNVVRDPELRTTQGGASVCNFTIAVNRRPKKDSGDQQADFIPIVAWRQLAELCGKYLEKGKKCAVVGSLQTRSYEAQDGSKRYVTEVMADEVEFLGGKGQADSAPPAFAGSAPADDVDLPWQ